jgi:hypothetical protein
MALLKNKMHLRLLIIALLSVLLLGARESNFMVMTVINKAGMEVAVSLVANDLSRAYYIVIPEGNRDSPSIKRFTVTKDFYRMRVFWMEEQDPETGADCRTSSSSRVTAVRNMRVVVGSCAHALPNAGEKTMYKFGRWRCME